MKKTLLFIITLLSIFAFTKVYAEGPFYFDWETRDTGALPRETVSYKDGYVTLDATNRKVTLSMYDDNGTLKYQKDFNGNGGFVNAYKDYIYLFYWDNDGDKILLLDEDFKTIKTLEIEVRNYKLVDEQIHILTYENNEYYDNTYSLDLTEINSAKTTDDDFFEDSNEIWDTFYEMLHEKHDTDTMNYINENIDYKDDKIAYFVVDESIECIPKPFDDPDMPDPVSLIPNNALRPNNIGKPMIPEKCTYPYVGLMNKNGEVIWEHELEDYIYATEVKIVDNYILVIAQKEYTTDTIVFDMEGNQKQEFTSDNGFTYLMDTDKGFAVNQGYCPSIKDYWTILEPAPDIDVSASVTDPTTATMLTLQQLNKKVGCSCDVDSSGFAGRSPKPISNVLELKVGACALNHQVYYLYHAIVPKITEGQGNIEVASKGKPGEPVTFVVTPDEGYTLGIIKVTTADGEVLTFTDNTFTMPTSDVTIEATFLAANPKTADIAISIILMVALATGLIALLERKRLKEMN